MSRSIRRFHAARMNLRYRNRCFNESPRWYAGAWPYDEPAHWWRHRERMSMSKTPSRWTHEMMMKPARARERAQLKHVQAGRIEPDAALFPLVRKPHIYYW